MSNNKKQKMAAGKRTIIILAVVLFVLCVAAGVILSGVFSAKKPAAVSKYDTQSYTTSLKGTFAGGSALLPTDFAGVYYGMSSTGDVTFYTLGESGLTAVPQAGQYSVSAECSGQTLSAVIHYIVSGSSTCGYGLFKASDHPDVYYYDYAFFKLRDLPSSFSSGSDLLLMIDTDQTRFNKADKVYSEAFYFDPNNQTTGDTFFSDAQRTVGTDGRQRSDFRMFTDEIMGQSQSNFLFLSSRFYLEYADSGLADVISSGSTGNNLDNIRYIQGVLGLVFWRTGDGVYYLSKTDTGFSLMVFDGQNSTACKNYDGDFDKDYIRSGAYLLKKSDGTVYDLFGTQPSYKLDYSQFASGFTADTFSISPDGSYALIRGTSYDGLPAIGLCNVKTGRVISHVNKMFSRLAAPVVLNSGVVICSIGDDDTLSTYTQYIFDINQTAETSTQAAA